MKAKKDINVFLEGYKEMILSLYGLDDKNFDIDEKYVQFKSSLEEFSKGKYGDFDVQISVAYRLGGTAKTSGVTKYKKAGSISDIAKKGINLPEDVTWFEIVAKPVIQNKALVFSSSNRKNVFYSQKIVVAKNIDFENSKESRDIYKVQDNVQIFDVEDLQEYCKLINLKKPKEIVV